MGCGNTAANRLPTRQKGMQANSEAKKQTLKLRNGRQTEKQKKNKRTQTYRHRDAQKTHRRHTEYTQKTHRRHAEDKQRTHRRHRRPAEDTEDTQKTHRRYRGHRHTDTRTHKSNNKAPKTTMDKGNDYTSRTLCLNVFETQKSWSIRIICRSLYVLFTYQDPGNIGFDTRLTLFMRGEIPTCTGRPPQY